MTAPSVAESEAASIADALRWVALHAVAARGSGHPGATSSLAEVLASLFHLELRFDPNDVTWEQRDRLILSAGHAVPILYAHLAAYHRTFPMESLGSLRTLGSSLPGHPERGRTPGIEATTGPLGQGVAFGVGTAVAEAMAHARFRDAGEEHHRTIVIAGDGDLMTGVAQEAIALAGLWRLDQLLLIWDANGVTSSRRSRELAGDDHLGRFAAAGWAVTEVDGHDVAAIAEAVRGAGDKERPTLVAAHTIAGRGLPGLEGSPDAHSARLQPADVAALARSAGYADSADLRIPAPLVAAISARRGALEVDVRDRRRTETMLPRAPREVTIALTSSTRSRSTRDAMRPLLHQLDTLVPGLVAVGVDSRRFTIPDAPEFSADLRSGRNMDVGVREHAMGGVLNALAAYGPFTPVGSCHFAFMDYLGPALRCAAMDRSTVILLASNDSVLIGEDGPTHQPVEQLTHIRSRPGVTDFRPADADELGAALELAIGRDGPSVVCLSPLEPSRTPAVDVSTQRIAGPRIVVDAGSDPDVVIVSSGGEVEICIDAAERLAVTHGLRCRVVSILSTRLLAEQPAAMEDLLAHAAVPIVAVEAAGSAALRALLPRVDAALSVEGYGHSGTVDDLRRLHGLTPEGVIDVVLSAIDH